MAGSSNKKINCKALAANARARPGRKPRRRLRALASFSVLLALSGCTTFSQYIHNGLKVGPNYHTPPAAVAGSWVDSADGRVSQQQPDDAYWWSSFNDPTLAGLVESAYRQNLPLKEAAFRVLAARAQYGFAVGNFLPQQQQMTSDYTRKAISENIANHQFTPQQFFDVWDGGFNLSWEIDFWGHYRRAITAARDQLQATEEDYNAVLVTLVGDVAKAYIEMRTYETEIAILQENVALTRRILKIATERFEGGATSEVDVEQIKALLALIESFIPEAQINQRKAANRLCVLLGIPTADLVRQVGPGVIPQVRPDVATGIPADLLRRRPDVRAAERLVAAQSEQIGIATANLYPHLYINGAIEVASTPIGKLFESKSISGGVGPSMQWNIFNYGRLLNQINVQKATFDQTVANYRNTVLTANEEAENGLVEFLRKQEQARDRKVAVEAAKKSVSLALEMYQDGRSDINRVFLMERELTQIQRFYVRSVGDIDLGLIQIYRALGGGWQTRIGAVDPAQLAAPPPPVPVGAPAPAATPAPSLMPTLPIPPTGPGAFTPPPPTDEKTKPKPAANGQPVPPPAPRPS